MTSDARITITLTPAQAAVVRKAVDLYHRLRLGQLGELANVWTDGWKNDWSKLEIVRNLCEVIKLTVFPELSPNSSYGVGCPELTVNDQRLYEIYKVLDHALWLSTPERLPYTTSGDDPYLLRFSGDAVIPYTVTT